jgi:UDP:flavonoid glycosyltransferase YjiC (YdhE family)
MDLLLATVGTTGDVRPFVALASHLRDRGHAVTAVSWELHRGAFREAGIDFEAAGPATSLDDIRSTAEAAASARTPSGQVAVLRDFHLREGRSHYRRLRELLPGHDVALIHGIHSLAQAAAVDAEVPWVSAAFDPVLIPSRSVPPAGMPNLGPGNPLAWQLLDRVLRRLNGPLDELLRDVGSHAVGLPHFRGRSTALHLLACSPAIAAVPPDLPASVRFTGAWAPTDPPRDLEPRVAAFLDRGPAPVIVSLGSMVGADPALLVSSLRSALARVGARAIVQAGLAGLRSEGPGTATDDADAGILFIGEADHRTLFPRAAAVVHHGGAGTTHAVAAAGVPSVVIPHVGDQGYWATRLRRLGVAPAPLPLRSLDGASLAQRLRAALEDGAMRARAAQLAETVRAERGTVAAALLLEEVAR